MPDGANANFAALFKTQAHVFEINPETKKEWIYKIKQAIPISIVASLGPSNLEIGSNEAATERGLKIVANYPNGEVAIDAFIHKDPRITFTKRTERFGQWLDQSEVLHGLGFSSEAELDSFMAAFQKLQREFSTDHHHHHHQQQQQQQQQQQPSQQSPPQSINSGQQQAQIPSYQLQQQVPKMTGWNQQQHQSQPHQINNNTSETNGRFPPNKSGSSGMQHQQYSNTLARLQTKREPIHSSNGNTGVNNGNATASENTINNYPRSQSMFGLQSKPIKSEKSSPDQGAVASHMNANQNDWQAREQLKYENERLKQILEENAKISKDWESELLNLRTNNIKLTQALQESKAHVQQWLEELSGLREENQKLKLKILSNDSEQENDYEKELQKYVDERVQDELRRKDDEIQVLQKSMDALTMKVAQSGTNQNGQTDDNANQISTYQKQKLENISARLEAKVLELSKIQKEFKQVVASD